MAKAEQSGNGGEKWPWRSKVALTEQSGDATAKRQVSSKCIASVAFFKSLTNDSNKIKSFVNGYS